MSVSDCFNVNGLPRQEDLLTAQFVQRATDDELVAALVQKGEAGDLYAAHLLARIYSGDYASGDYIAIRVRFSDMPGSGTITIDREFPEHLIDQKDAFKWATQAAKTGNTDDLCAVAWHYRDGTGCEKDPRRALEVYLQYMACAHRNGETLGESDLDFLRDLLNRNPDLKEKLAKGVRLHLGAETKQPAPVKTNGEDCHYC